MIELTLQLPRNQYRALMEIASAREINAHVLIEQMVDRALTRTPGVVIEPEPEPTPEVVPNPKRKPTPRPGRDRYGRIVQEKPKDWKPPLGLEPLPPAAPGRQAPGVTEARYERIRVLYREGFGDADIAWSAGMLPTSMRSTRTRLGLTNHSNRKAG